MENKDKPAFPMDATYNSEFVANGLTKREMIAAMAMQGLLANPQFVTRIAPMTAISMADELLKQLEQ